MTLWHSGDDVNIDVPLKLSHIAEYKNGAYWVLAGITFDGSVIYSVRKWQNGQTIWSPSKSVTSKKCPELQSIQIFESEWDGYFQIILGEKTKWIKPGELSELEQPP